MNAAEQLAKQTSRMDKWKIDPALHRAWLKCHAPLGPVPP
jgi:hypothetical protein